MPMPKKRMGVFLLALGLVWKFATIGATATLIAKFGWKFFPAHLGWAVLGTAFALPGLALIQRWFPALIDRLTLKPEDFEKPFWAWCRRRGPYVLTVAVTLAFEQIAAAVLLKAFSVSGWRAWLYALTADAIASLVTFAFYLYAYEGLKAAFLSLVH